MITSTSLAVPIKINTAFRSHPFNHIYINKFGIFKINTTENNILVFAVKKKIQA